MASTLDPVVGQHRQQEFHESWQPITQPLLEILVNETDSNYAIFRTEDVVTGNLVLERFAPLAPERQHPKIAKGQFEIPIEKALSCWEVDPRKTWGVTCEGTKLRSIPQDIELGQGECNFIQWIHHKAWFPLAIDESKLGLIVLVRGENIPYSFGEITSTWIAAQEYLSQHLPGQSHYNYCRALSALNLVRESTTEATLLKAICHCLTSRYGFEWNRAWILEHTPSGDQQLYAFRSALGEVNKARWDKVVPGLGGTYPTLEDEVKAVIEHPESDSDALYESCCKVTQPVEIGVWDELSTLSCSEKLRSGQASQQLFVKLPVESHLVAKHFDDSVSKMVGQLGYEYQNDAVLYALPLCVRDRKLLIFLSQTYQLPPKKRDSGGISMILTTSFLQQAAAVISEWESSMAARNEVQQLD